MRLYDRIRGVALVEIHAVLPEALLNLCARHELGLWALERPDGCTLRFRVHESELTKLERLAAAAQAELSVLSRIGGRTERRRLGKRWGLLLSLLLGAALLAWSNLYIWEIELRGCESLTTGEVLRALADCGVTEGTYWPSISNETLRNEMLLRLPKLAWMTVNVSGSRAVVLVAERVEKPEIYAEHDAAEVIAARSGIVRKLSVLNGRPLVSPGGAVLTGETLVTGRLESLTGGARSVRAEAEVWADTWYEWNAVEPAVGAVKGACAKKTSRWALRFGKNRINLSFGSRKELDGYDKIVHEYNMGVEGLFRLPVGLICEEYRLASRTETAPRDSGASARLEALLAERIEGELVQARCHVSVSEGFAWTTLRAQCCENIAQTAETAPP